MHFWSASRMLQLQTGTTGHGRSWPTKPPPSSEYLQRGCLSPQDLIYFTPPLRAAGSPLVLLLFLLAVTVCSAPHDLSEVWSKGTSPRAAGQLDVWHRLESSWRQDWGQAQEGLRVEKWALDRPCNKDRVRVCSLEGGNSVQLLQEQEVHNQFWKSKMSFGASDRTQVNEVWNQQFRCSMKMEMFALGKRSLDWDLIKRTIISDFLSTADTH